MIDQADALAVALQKHNEVIESTHEYNSMPDIETCIKALLRANCKVFIAARQLNVPKEDLALYLGQHKDKVLEAVRTITLVEALDNLSYASNMFKAALTDPAMLPSDVAKSYTRLLAAVNEMSAPKQQGGTTVIGNVNVTQQLLEQIPPEDRHAVLALVEQKRLIQNGQLVHEAYTDIIDHDLIDQAS